MVIGSASNLSMGLRMQASEESDGFIIVPHGVEHMPVAEGETEIMLFEPDTTLNTGNVVNERTVAQLQHV